jgi:hypothetical protein
MSNKVKKPVTVSEAKTDDTEKMAADLRVQIEAAKKARADKLAQSKSHLVDQLAMVSRKYKTVNGYMQSRQTIAEIADDLAYDKAAKIALDLAQYMSKAAGELSAAIESTDLSDISEAMLDGLLDEAFIDRQDDTVDPVEVATQLLVAALLQNVGPSIDDIVDFRDSTDSDIAKMEEMLAGLQAPALKLVDEE